MTDKKVILGVQYLRGLAALGVLLCHYGSSIKGYSFLVAAFQYGQTGVHVFFLISGFIIVYSLSKANYKPAQFLRFLAKRSIRIDPAYYATIILTILLFRILSAIPSFNGSAIPFIPQQFVAHILYVVPFTKYPFYNHIFWTLCIEFQFYILVGLLYFLSDRKIYRTLFLLLFCATSFIKPGIGYYLVSTYAPIFCLGISLVDVVNDRKINNLILPAVFAGMVAYQFGAGIFFLLMLSCIIIVFVNTFNKPLFLLGEISYSLYLIHPLVFIVVAGVLKKLNFNLADHQLWWLLLEAIIAVLLTRLFYLAIERPSLWLSKRIFYKKSKG